MTFPASNMNKSESNKSSEESDNHVEANGSPFIRESSKKRPADDDPVNQPPPKRRNDVPEPVNKRKLDEKEGPSTVKRRKIDCYPKETFFTGRRERSLINGCFLVASFNIIKWLKEQGFESNFTTMSDVVFSEMIDYIITGKPDIICLQEVPESLWNKINERVQGIWIGSIHGKTDNECLNVILFNNKFEEVNFEQKSIKALCIEAVHRACNIVDDKIKKILDGLSDIPTCVMCILKIVTAKNKPFLIVGNSHISANNGESDMSCLQTASLFWYLSQKIVDIRVDNSLVNSPLWLWCGDFDFNCKALDSMCKVGYPDSDAINELSTSVLFQSCCHAFQHPIHTAGIFWSEETEDDARYIWIDGQMRPDRVCLENDAVNNITSDGSDNINNCTSVIAHNNRNGNDLKNVLKFICTVSFSI